MGHDHKWNQNKEGYHYSKEEIEAYKVPYRIAAGPCVDTFIPLRICFNENPESSNHILFVPFFRRGRCSQQFQQYDHCLTHWQTYENNSHVTNAYWLASDKAHTDGISATYAGVHKKGLAWLTL